MPSSHPELIPHVVNMVRELKPKSVLDVGIGFGKYGFLFREYLDVWSNTKSAKMLKRRNWKTRIDGIEVHKPYLSAVQRAVYDEIFIGNALELIPTLDSYDLIFIGDVIEHLARPEALMLMEMAKAKAKVVLLTTPARPSPQGPIYGNKHEEHQSFWVREDFSDVNGSEYYLIEGVWGLIKITNNGAKK